jgi:hypothetical protein
MKFDDASLIESIAYDIRLADYVRGKNRARINDLFNGVKPFASDEENKVNVNFLEGTSLAHDARSQLSGIFLKPGQYFRLTTDYGTKANKRPTYAAIATKEMNRIMKRSLPYFECFRGKFAMDVLHGIGPAVWPNEESWCPEEQGIEDIGIPSNTRLSMKNLPFFYVYRSYTVPELKRLTRNEAEAKKVGWNVDLVNQCIEWVDKQSTQLMGSNWPEVWSPEKVSERMKGDGTFYSSDSVPTIDAFDFYYWSDDGGVEGWRRRIILDAWSTPAGPNQSGGRNAMERKKDSDFMRGDFLLNSKDRVYGSKVSEIVSFQFADLSSVAPFRYHSVRSLGYLLYAACHLQNRMRCRFTAAAFEAAMQYFRVNSTDTMERALKVDLVDKGIIDPSVQFVPQAERWQYDTEMMEMFMRENRSLIDKHSSSYTAQAAQSPGDRKTKFQVMAETSQATALVTSALMQAYQYQEFEYREIMRRFFIRESRDPDVKEFRAACLRQNVPEDALEAAYWDLQAERVMGAGNKTMEMQISEQLMNMRHLYDPEPQRDILRRVTTAITDDPDWSMSLVPDQPLKVSDSVHDAQLSIATLMAGYPVAMKTGQNHKEYVQVYLFEMGQEIQGIEKQKGMAPPDKIQGWQNVAQATEMHLKLLAQDPEEKQFVTEAEKQLSKLMNLVRAFMQRLEQQQKKQQQQQGGDPAAQAKAQATMMQAQVKMKNSKDAAAQKLAQKQLEFQQKLKMEEAKAGHEIHRENLKFMHEQARQPVNGDSGE